MNKEEKMKIVEQVLNELKEMVSDTIEDDSDKSAVEMISVALAAYKENL